MHHLLCGDVSHAARNLCSEGHGRQLWKRIAALTIAEEPEKAPSRREFQQQHHFFSRDVPDELNNIFVPPLH